MERKEYVETMEHELVESRVKQLVISSLVESDGETKGFQTISYREPLKDNISFYFTAYLGDTLYFTARKTIQDMFTRLVAPVLAEISDFKDAYCDVTRQEETPQKLDIRVRLSFFIPEERTIPFNIDMFKVGVLPSMETELNQFSDFLDQNFSLQAQENLDDYTSKYEILLERFETRPFIKQVIDANKNHTPKDLLRRLNSHSELTFKLLSHHEFKPISFTNPFTYKTRELIKNTCLDKQWIERGLKFEDLSENEQTTLLQELSELVSKELDCQNIRVNRDIKTFTQTKSQVLEAIHYFETDMAFADKAERLSGVLVEMEETLRVLNENIVTKHQKGIAITPFVFNELLQLV